MESMTASRITPLREPDLDRLRQPPANTEAEQALLGAMLINNTAYHRVVEFLLPEHFGSPVHGRIYAATGKLIERGQIADPVTLKNLFDQDGALADIGGAQYLAHLVNSAVPSITGARSTIFICGAN
jgi:replicative DNA helicase